MAKRTATPASPTPPPAPSFVPAGAKWDSTFGYPMTATGRDQATGIYLNLYHLTALSTAAEGPGCYKPEFGSDTDMVISGELRTGGLVDRRNNITAAGLWHLANRGWK